MNYLSKCLTEIGALLTFCVCMELTLQKSLPLNFLYIFKFIMYMCRYKCTTWLRGLVDVNEKGVKHTCIFLIGQR
jgi:hypothetical protein